MMTVKKQDLDNKQTETEVPECIPTELEVFTNVTEYLSFPRQPPRGDQKFIRETQYCGIMIYVPSLSHQCLCLFEAFDGRRKQLFSLLSQAPNLSSLSLSMQ